MAFPMVAIISALKCGGTLVPHAAGGMIVTSTGGYVAGTYLSTTAIGSLLAASSTALGASAVCLTGAASKLIGGAGIFGTTVGATGIKGFLMSAGIISSTPIWIPVVVGGIALCGAVGLGYGGYKLMQLRQKIEATPVGDEAQFLEDEAQIVEGIIRKLGQ